MYKKFFTLKSKNNFQKRIILIAFALTIGLFVFYIKYPQKTHGALTNASATLSNPRLSYKGVIATGTSLTTLITINGSTSYPDHDTYGIMPKDTTCFAPTTLVGCRDNTAYTVVGIGTSLTYNVDPALATTLTAGDYAISTASGTLTLTFTLGNSIPVGGDILITIPMADSQSGADSLPDAANSTSLSGFDIGIATTYQIGTADVTVTESCGGDFSGTKTITPGSGSTDHTIRIDNSGAECASTSTLTVGIGTTSNGHLLVNPAPISSGSRVRGQADAYTINIKTRDASDVERDNTNVMVAPIEAVLVSATVQEMLTFRVCGVKTDLSTQESGCFSTPGTVCGAASLSASSYAYSVPFGTLSSSDTFSNLAQYMYVSTNAYYGYSVKIQQNDQMGKDGKDCTGTDPLDPVTTSCIPDNPGYHSTCEYNAADDVTAAATNGLAYSLDDGPQTGSPTFAVKYDTMTGGCVGIGGTFCAKCAAADQQQSETPQTIISKSTAVSFNDAFVCWRLSVDTLQPAGYYYNKVKYTAVPVF